MFNKGKNLISISSMGGKKQLNELKNPEAVAQGCSVKREFLKISQNSQEITCAGVSFSAKFLRTPIL